MDGILLKKGDIKVDSDDLITLFDIIENIQCVIGNNLDVLDENERKELDISIEKSHFLRIKYLLIANCRRQEHLWYELLKIIDNGNYIECMDDVEKIDQKFELESYMKLIGDLIINNQELAPNVKILIGIIIKIHGHENVRRSVWGHYLQVKTERERLKDVVESLNNDL